MSRYWNDYLQHDDFDAEEYLEHGWGKDALSKAKEKAYNAAYYLKNKAKWVKYKAKSAYYKTKDKMNKPSAYYNNGKAMPLYSSEEKYRQHYLDNKNAESADRAASLAASRASRRNKFHSNLDKNNPDMNWRYSSTHSEQVIANRNSESKHEISTRAKNVRAAADKKNKANTTIAKVSEQYLKELESNSKTNHSSNGKRRKKTPTVKYETW